MDQAATARRRAGGVVSPKPPNDQLAYEGDWPQADCPGVYAIKNVSIDPPREYVGGTDEVRERCRLQFKYLVNKDLKRAVRRMMPDYEAGHRFVARVLELCPESEIETVEQRWLDEIRPHYNATLKARLGAANRRTENRKTVSEKTRAAMAKKKEIDR